MDGKLTIKSTQHQHTKGKGENHARQCEKDR